MATYPEWNEALCAFLFNDENAGKAVYLHVPEEAFTDDDRLSALGGYQAFKADMLRELGGAPEDLLTTADRKWQNDLRHLRPEEATIIPGHLSLMLVLAAATEVVREDIEPHAFYPLIPCFFGLRPEGFQLREKDLIPKLYGRISSWSRRYSDGQKGVFEPQQLGARSKVGLIQGQTIYRISDVEELRYRFHLAGYRPGDEYSAEEFEQVLRKGSFSPRIEKALSNEHLRKVAVLRAQEELDSWDGTLSDEFKVKLAEDSGESGRVLLQLFQDGIRNARRTIGIRLRQQRDYFDDYTALIPTSRRQEGRQVFVKRLVVPDPVNPGLSKVVIKHVEASDEKVSSFTSDFEIQSEDKTLVFKYKAKPVRFFVPAESAGMVRVNGWVDTPVITKGRRHIIMIERTFYDEFMRCNSSKLVKPQAPQEPIDEGLKLLFQFLSVERIEETLVDARGRVVGSFAMADRPKVRLMSGLKASGRGNVYMRNSPPRIQVIGLTNELKVQFDSHYLTKIGEDIQPGDTSVDLKAKPGAILPDSLIISVLDREKLILARCELRFVDYSNAEVIDPPVNAIGAIVDAVQGSDPYRPRVAQGVLLSLPELKVLGRRPGEIGLLNRYSDMVEPFILAEIRGNEKTLHYVGKDKLASDGLRLSFNSTRTPAFMGPAFTQAWARFLFEGNVRCGICALPLPDGRSYPDSSPIGPSVGQFREFVKANFPIR